MSHDQQEFGTKSNKKCTNFNVILFSICWLFIGAVGSLDTHLTVKLRDGLIENEINPVARMILSVDDWDVSLFVGIKMFSTIIVLGILVWFQKHTKYGSIIIVPLAIFQLLLLFYLLS